MAGSITLTGLTGAEVVCVLQARNELLNFRSNNDTSTWIAPALQINAEYSQEKYWIPAWSDSSLGKTLDGVISSPGGGIGIAFRGLWTALGETRAPLSLSMSNFLAHRGKRWKYRGWCIPLTYCVEMTFCVFRHLKT
jgi:hypothetical protein